MTLLSAMPTGAEQLIIASYVVYEGLGVYLASGGIAAPEGCGGTGGSTVVPRVAGGAPLHPRIPF